MPEIPVGDMVRKLKLPPWLRWFMNLVQGIKIGKGDIVVVLDEQNTVGPARTGLDQPHKFEPPRVGPR